MNILTAYYRLSAHYLKDHLPYIPELKLTNAKRYRGKIYFKNNRFDKIALSKWNLDIPDFLIDQEDIDEIIDTICHEFAHMLFWEHGEDHTEVTELFKTLVTSELEIARLNKQLQALNC